MTTTEVWTDYNEDLKRFIISKTKDTTIANDILQDTFIRIHSNLDGLKDQSKMKSWVFTIARNTIIDYFKSSKKTVALLKEEIAFEDSEKTHTEKDCLYGIVKNLPKKYRNPLFLSDIKGMKQQEIAKQLKLPLPTVKSQIQRARKLIAQGFMDCCNYTVNENGKLVGEIQEKEDCKVCN